MDAGPAVVVVGIALACAVAGIALGMLIAPRLTRIVDRAEEDTDDRAG
jgi:hypothetical protein